MQGENWLVATPMLTMLPLPFWVDLLGEKLQPIRYYKIESPSELYAGRSSTD
jgi:hypothetical protein